jgi:hypothetical protein
MYHSGYTTNYAVSNYTQALVFAGSGITEFRNFMNAAPYRSVWVDSDCNGTKDALSVGAELTISKNLSFEENQYISVGIMGDNKFKLSIDGQLILAVLGGAITQNFTYLHFFKIYVTSGQHLFSFTGIGDGSVNDSLGVIVLNNSIESIMSGIPKNQWNVLYSSYDSLIEGLDIVTCPTGYAYDQNSNLCVKITGISYLAVNDYAIITSSVNIPGAISGWTIDYGDGVTSGGTGAPPISFVHQYTSANTYTITHTVYLETTNDLIATLVVVVNSS